MMVFQKGRHIRRYSPHIAWAGRAAEYAGIGRAAVKTRRGLRALESCVSCLSHQTPVIFFNFRLTSLPCNDINAVSVMVLAWDCKELTETFTQSKRKGRGFAPRPAPLALVAELALRLRDVGLGILYPAREELRLHLLRLISATAFPRSPSSSFTNARLKLPFLPSRGVRAPRHALLRKFYDIIANARGFQDFAPPRGIDGSPCVCIIKHRYIKYT